ncbi:hypothetical protein [Streptomyces sp. NPDC058867]|uniref:hypothetical protein n=1 Tax=unclassified Streptomyces TaxID=2593676 RepID=UPI0036B4E23A
MSEHTPVKYPFEFNGMWSLRHQIPYDITHEGRSYQVLATIFARPSVHGRIQIGCDGKDIAQYDNLVPGNTVEITGDTWRVTTVAYRTRIVLERVRNASAAEEGHRVSADEA